ncbi:MAG: AAA domain-containing protein, partial [Holophagales bacterium]|nr:AAA domain-containing protein [Holophagales bacterium]
MSDLTPLRDLLDHHVVGHDEVKTALLLALITREHIYVEGPPGTAKTRLAEVAAKGSELDFFFYQLHRDTRLAELVGDIVLE